MQIQSIRNTSQIAETQTRQRTDAAPIQFGGTHADLVNRHIDGAGMELQHALQANQICTQTCGTKAQVAIGRSLDAQHIQVGDQPIEPQAAVGDAVVASRSPQAATDSDEHRHAAQAQRHRAVTGKGDAVVRSAHLTEVQIKVAHRNQTGRDI